MSGTGEEEDLAAAWGAALEEEGSTETPEAPAAADAARVLNQAEIDSLLGFGAGPAREAEESGIQRIISSGLISYERLPMLEIVFDRLVRLMSTTLRNFTSDNVDVSIDGIVSLRFGDYLNSVPLPAMLGVTRADDWDNYGLAVVDSALISSVVDVVLDDLTSAFEPLCPVNFRFERVEVNPRFAVISRPSNACVLVRLRVDMEDRGGKLEILLPYATLEPVRELLLQQFMGEKFGRDSIWETHLAEELRHTDIGLDVVLDEQIMPLSTVLNLKVGDRIALGVAPGAPVSLRCGDVPLFEGEMGRKGQRLAVRIEKDIERRKGATS